VGSGSEAWYRIPVGRHRVEEAIQRSRFVTTVAHAPSVDAAQEFIAEMREEFPDATHNCWAFVAGPPGDSARIGMSDDGEPHGTAGMPMLTTLLHGGVGEIVAVVTRYYGGVKLGTGGLTRAYSSGVKLALANLPTVERVERAELAVTFGYADVDGFRRIVDEFRVLVRDERYDSAVTYLCGVPVPCLERFREAVTNLTRGSALFNAASSRTDLPATDSGA